LVKVDILMDSYLYFW